MAELQESKLAAEEEEEAIPYPGSDVEVDRRHSAKKNRSLSLSVPSLNLGPAPIFLFQVLRWFCAAGGQSEAERSTESYSATSRERTLSQLCTLYAK